MPAKVKSATKTPAKRTTPAAKTSTVKASSSKTAAKVAVKKPAPQAATPVTAKKPVAKSPATKPSASAVKQKPAPAKSTPATPVKKPAAKSPAATKKTMPISTTAASKTDSKAADSKADTRVMPPTTVMTASGVPQRTGRPSSRLASLTVPSMAQSVASTAAKASYAPLPVTQVIIPPLASSTHKDPKLANNWKTKPVDQLSDAELLAMPDDEYMNEKQLAAFRLKLTLLKREILASAGETTEHLREDTVVVPDPADRATIEEEHALELRTRDRERKLLKKIEQSIGRIDAGDYGYCDETGEPIGVGRLLARPTATLSLEAQQRRELKQKMFGD
ncbi:MAG: RNA polymerase-binding protein DksA [Rhodoferax sp.]|nr:RNA polymerase-binding protein DksA [Rhodoferax sp.]HQX58569.1 RNA polymerase-binding protein DksA [Burkholderiaceae bacterium]